MTTPRIFTPLRIRDFALLWTGMIASLFGDGIYLVAIAWQVYELSDAPTALGAVGIAWSIPVVLFVLVGGVVSDRVDRRLVLILSAGVRGLAVLGIGLLSVTGALELWHVIALVAFFGTGDAFFGPSFGAIVPDIVPEEQLVEANSLNQLVEPIGLRLAGPALGGVAIAAFGVGEAFLLIGAAFACSVTALALMRARPAPPVHEDRSVRRDVREAFRFARTQTWLWGTLCAAAIALLAFVGPVDVLLPLVVKNDFDGGADDLGLIFAAGGVGAVLAALAIGHRGLPKRHITFMYIAWTIGTLLIAGFGLATELWQAMVVSFVMQAAFTSGLVVWATLMQRLVPPELRGRVASFDWFVSVSLIPVSFALTGPVAGWVGIDTTLIGAGVASAIATLAFLFVRGMRDTERDGSLRGALRSEEIISSANSVN